MCFPLSPADWPLRGRSGREQGGARSRAVRAVLEERWRGGRHGRGACRRRAGGPRATGRYNSHQSAPYDLHHGHPFHLALNLAQRVHIVASFTLLSCRRWCQGAVLGMRAPCQVALGGRALRRVRAVRIFPAVLAVEVVGGAVGHAAHVPHVPRAGEGRVRGGVRLSGTLWHM